MRKKKIFNLKQGINKIIDSIKELIEKGKGVVIIGIAGGSGSGKGYVAVAISKATGAKIFLMDDYYIGIDKMKDRNFDCPSAFEMSLLKKHLKLLKKGKVIRKPVYNFVIRKRVRYESYFPSKVIIVEGLFALNRALRGELDLKVFVEAPEKLRLQRRMNRDIKERGRTKESVLWQWLKSVKNAQKICCTSEKIRRFGFN
ncbi:uridine kinase [bacterium]|nr:uridine kinase [bacterium]